MAGKVNDYGLDNGLAALKSTATHMYICSAEPTTYAEATVTYALGNKSFGAGAVFPGAVAPRSPNGRKITTAAVTDGTVTGTGTAIRWAVVDSGNSRLLIDNDLAAGQAVTAGNIFSLPSFDFGIPGS
jgi:hypothetical protein